MDSNDFWGVGSLIPSVITHGQTLVTHVFYFAQKTLCSNKPMASVSLWGKITFFEPHLGQRGILFNGMKSERKNTSLLNNPSVSTIATTAQWDDELLVNRALAGDSFAENAIYRRYAPYLLNLATRLTRRVCDGDDVLQETFMVAFQKLNKLENPNALRAWLVRILLSQVRKSLRIRRFRAFFGMNELEMDASLQLLAVHDVRPDLRAELQDIDDVLQQSPEKWRTAWMLRRIEGMSIYETAQATNVSVATIKRYIAAVDVAIQTHRRLAP